MRPRFCAAVYCLRIRAERGAVMKRFLLCVVALIGVTEMDTAKAQAPSPLLAIDQHRTTVVERIDSQWGEALAYSGAGVSRPQLREMLMGLRADHLLAASLAGSLTGLRDVLAQ